MATEQMVLELTAKKESTAKGYLAVERMQSLFLTGNYVYTLAGEWGTGSHLLVVPGIDVSIGIALGLGKQRVQKRSKSARR